MDLELGDVSEIEESSGRGMFGEEELGMLDSREEGDHRGHKPSQHYGRTQQRNQQRSQQNSKNEQSQTLNKHQTTPSTCGRLGLPVGNILSQLDLSLREVSFEEEIYDIYGVKMETMRIEELIENRTSNCEVTKMGQKGCTEGERQRKLVKKYTLDFKAPTITFRGIQSNPRIHINKKHTSIGLKAPTIKSLHKRSSSFTKPKLTFTQPRTSLLHNIPHCYPHTSAHIHPQRSKTHFRTSRI